MRTTLFVAVCALVVGCGGSSKKDDTTPDPTSETPPATPPGETPAPAEKPAPPPPPPSTDPLDVGPDIYKKALDNETVRVLEVTFAPGAKIAMHKHPDHAGYVVSGGKLKLMGEDGKEETLDLKAGNGLFIPATTHAAENIGTTEVKLAVVELKKKGSGPAPEGSKDPLKVAKGNYKKVFEDDHVRILEVNLKKGAKVKEHGHADHVAYVITGGKMKISPKDGEPQEMEMTPGQAMFIPAGAHMGQNTGTTPIKAAIFEIK